MLSSRSLAARATSNEIEGCRTRSREGVVIRLRTTGASEWAAIAAALEGISHPAPEVALLSHVVVAEDEGTVVGVAAVEAVDTVAFLRLLFVSPVHRGQGLGTRMARRAVQNGFERGFMSVFVSAARLETFYYRAGFGPDDYSFLPGCFWPRAASDRAHPSVMSCRRAIGGRLGDGGDTQVASRRGPQANPGFVPRRDCDFEP
jgi:N-acetylglutamate synthase-like GNAT family acetyltransferase